MIINIIYGFLGAGKTTFIRYLLEHPPEGEKRIILVNEFGEIGIDGLIIRACAAEVVEMPSGCICCTMAQDFRRQVMELSEKYSPDRLIIEPTGVAAISQIMMILGKEELTRLYKSIRLIHILDASEFLLMIKANRRFIENQIRAGHIVILNKIDRIKPAMAAMLISSIMEINPKARVYPANFARLQSGCLAEILNAESDPQDSETSFTASEYLMQEPGYESFGKRWRAEIFQPGCLQILFEKLMTQQYGEVVRAKGIFRTDNEPFHIELASGEIRITPGPVCEESVVSVIGRNISRSALDANLQNCILT